MLDNNLGPEADFWLFFLADKHTLLCMRSTGVVLIFVPISESAPLV